MKGTTLASVAFAGSAAAFPSILKELQEREAGSNDINTVKRQSPSIVPFDAESQYIDTTGDHAFNPPGPNDQRGP